jgi:quinol monooxygenase YgiN
MIVVAGAIYVVPGQRVEFLAASSEAMVRAREVPGCQDFVVAADPVDPSRVNVFELWDTEFELMDFRGQGPDQETAIKIVDSDVMRYQISSSGPA